MEKSGPRDSETDTSDSACLSTQLCRLQALAQSSLWDQVVKTLKDTETSKCVEVVLEKALSEGQWDCVVRLACHCSVQQRERAVQQAATHDQWSCVTEMVEMGVGSAVRSGLLKLAVAECQVQCATLLVGVGVHGKDKEDILRQAVDSGQCDFVLELVAACGAPDLRDFVLREAVKKKHWPLVWGLVMQGLDLGQLESLCDDAVACRQWDLVIRLLHQGVSPSEWIISELYQNQMVQPLLDGINAGSLSSGLMGLLLMVGVRHGQGEVILHIIQREKVSETELMEVMKYAVYLKDKDVFLKLIKQSPRCRRVFSLRCHQHDWTGSEICGELSEGKMGVGSCWIYHTLCSEGEHDLAVHVAIANGIGRNREILEDVLDFRKQKFRHLLMKLYNDEKYEFQKLVSEKYRQYGYSEEDSFLLRLVIRLGEFDFAASLCASGVHRSDLKFAVPWLLVNQDTEAVSSFRRQLGGAKRAWFEKYILQYALEKYFKEQSESSLMMFIDLFKSCNDETVCSQLFRAAVAKAVKHDYEECFVKVCHNHVSSYVLSYDLKSTEDFRYAYSTALEAGRKHFIAQVCRTRLANSLDTVAEIIVLQEVMFEAQAWDVLPFLADCMVKPYYGLDSDHSSSEPLQWWLHKMLRHAEIWKEVAPVLDLWLRKVDFGLFQDIVQSISILPILHQDCRFSLSSLAFWSGFTRYCNLTFVLAYVAEEWELVEPALDIEGFDLKEELLFGAIDLASCNFEFAVSVKILKICSLTHYSVGKVNPRQFKYELAIACEEQGLTDWALVLSHLDFQAESDCIAERLRSCKNQVVLDCVMDDSVKNFRWKIVKELLSRCFTFSSSRLTLVLRGAFASGQVEIAEAVIGKVDSSCISFSDDDLYNQQTLLHGAIANGIGKEKEKVTKLVNLCIASGLSTFQRDVPFEENRYLREPNCPLWFALNRDKVWIVRLMLRCGAYTHKRLHKLIRDERIQRRLKLVKESRRNAHRNAKWIQGYNYIVAAAATPSRLEHMARLKVSHLIGCRPGRAERIESLPVPQLMQDLIHFKDIVHTEDSDMVHSDDSDIVHPESDSDNSATGSGSGGSESEFEY